MMIVKNFTLDNVEYMVCDSTKGYVPERAGLALLANRRLGVGADRVLVFTGTQQQTSFQLYDAAGKELSAQKQDYLVFAAYLQREGITANAVEMVKALGDQAVLGARGMDISCFEVHVTEAFCQKLRSFEQKAEKLAV